MCPVSLAKASFDASAVPEGRGARVVMTMSGFDAGDRKQMFARNAAERGYRNTLADAALALKD
ncbi:hypothetical protein MTP03_45350 [Tsukamurella sp. PLM1]|nr:hypothetical protein MTP03_45350 [Tsukamurella sp. PLM1]